MKMKMFAGNGDESVLEGELNAWLTKNPYITVKDIKQSYVSSGEKLFTLMSIWYENCAPVKKVLEHSPLQQSGSNAMHSCNKKVPHRHEGAKKDVQ